MSLYLSSSSDYFPGVNATATAGNDSNVSGTTLVYTTVTTTNGDSTNVSLTPQLSMDKENTQLIQFVLLGVLAGILALLGFLGNTLSMVVLQRRQMRSSTSYYLLSLAVYDNCILLGMVLYFILPALAPYLPSLRTYQSTFALTIPAGYPLSLAAQMGSIYTCVGFTVERFIAVCRPLHVANTCTKSRTLRVILLIFIWSILYNIPRFFHYQIRYRTEEQAVHFSATEADATSVITYTNCSRINTTDTTSLQNISPLCFFGLHYDWNATSKINSSASSNMSYSNQLADALLDRIDQKSTPSLNMYPPNGSTTVVSQVIVYEETNFGSNTTFQHLYLIYSQLFFMFLLPFLVILVMNVALIQAVKRSKSMRLSMSASASKEHNLNVMLIAVIVVFLVCQFPTIVDNILVAVVGEAQLMRSYSYKCFYTSCSFMVTINAASNFLLYCFFGKKFRTTLLGILGLKKKQHQVAYRSTVSKYRTNGTRTFDMEVSVM